VCFGVVCEDKCQCLDANSAENTLSVASSSTTAVFILFFSIFMNVVCLPQNIKLFMKHLVHEVLWQQIGIEWWSCCISWHVRMFCIVEMVIRDFVYVLWS
jgi:hypothetical protein